MQQVKTEGIKYFIEDIRNGKWLKAPQCYEDIMIDTRKSIEDDEERQWTNDPNSAYQWDSFDEAESYRKEFWDIIDIKVTEHEFVNAPYYENVQSTPSPSVKTKEEIEKLFDDNADFRLLLDSDKYMTKSKFTSLIQSLPGTGKMQEVIANPIQFLEWVHDNGYMRLYEEGRYKWFKVGDPITYTNKELYELFVKEIKKELVNISRTEEIKQLNIEANKLNGI